MGRPALTGQQFGPPLVVVSGARPFSSSPTSCSVMPPSIGARTSRRTSTGQPTDESNATARCAGATLGQHCTSAWALVLRNKWSRKSPRLPEGWARPGTERGGDGGGAAGSRVVHSSRCRPKGLEGKSRTRLDRAAARAQRLAAILWSHAWSWYPSRSSNRSGMTAANS